MPSQHAPETKRIQYLTKLIESGRTKGDNSRPLSLEEIAKYQREKQALVLRRKRGIETRRHVSAEADRVIASTETAVRQGTATLERRFDRLEANLASSSSGRDDLLQRLVGQPGSSKEIQAEIDARKQDLKRKRKEEREEDKQAEKRRKLEEQLEVALEEGDTLQDGVVLRGDLGRRKMRGLQAVGDFRFGSLRCCLVEIGETATLQLDPLSDQQLTVLKRMAASNNWPGTVVKLLAVTKDGTVEAQFLKEKLCGPNRRPVKQPLAVRFTSRNFHPSQVFAPKPVEPVEPVAPVEPVERVEPVQPVQPVERVEPAQPDEVMEPVEPVPVEPDKPMEAVEPAQPDEPMEPVEETVEPLRTAPHSTGMVGDSWEITLNDHTVRLETKSLASWGSRSQNDIIGKLENPEDQEIVDSWRGEDLLTEKSPCSGIKKGELWVRGKFLTAHATKLGGPEPTVPPVKEPPSKEETQAFFEEIAQEQAHVEYYVRQRERRESLERMEAAGYQRIRGFLAKPLGDGWIELALEEFYKEAQLRVSSGFQDNYVGKCHLIRDGQIREVKSLPDLDSLAGVQVHVKLLKPRLRIDYNAPVIDPPAPAVPPAVAAAPAVEAPAEEAVEAPAEEAVEAPAEEAVEAPAEEAVEAPAEEAVEAPAEEAVEAPAQEAVEAPAEEAPTYPSGEVVRGGLVGYELDGEGNFELKASTLQEYREALPILRERMADGSVDSCELMVGETNGKQKWCQENQPYHITRNDKLMMPKAKKSVAPEEAIVVIHWA